MPCCCWCYESWEIRDLLAVSCSSSICTTTQHRQEEGRAKCHQQLLRRWRLWDRLHRLFFLALKKEDISSSTFKEVLMDFGEGPRYPARLSDKLEISYEKSLEAQMYFPGRFHRPPTSLPPPPPTPSFQISGSL